LQANGQITQNTSGPPRSAEAESSPDKEPSTKQKILRDIATLPFVTVCGLAFGFTAGLLCVVLISPSAPGTRDYVFYWATGQQLAHHGNPYDPAANTWLERSAGLSAQLNPGLMRNPPWALPLVYPLGFLGSRAGWVIWLLLLSACLAASVYMLWIIYGRPKNRRYLLGYSFGPALICLIFGQITIFALLGLVLFLRLHRSQPFLAGCALWLCALKPHLFLPFGAVLVAWALASKCYKLLAGAAAALATSCAITFLIYPLAWSQYAQMARSSGIEMEYIPCLSYLLRSWLSPHSVWLQYLPAALGCVWALAYYWPRRLVWDWTKNGSLLMLVSILVAPYSWIYDQGLVIPALLQGAFRVRIRALLIALAFLSALVEIALFRSLSHPKDLVYWTLWTAPAWLAWYLIATRNNCAVEAGIPPHP
jgi:hypothetical protein